MAIGAAWTPAFRVFLIVNAFWMVGVSHGDTETPETNRELERFLRGIFSRAMTHCFKKNNLEK